MAGDHGTDGYALAMKQQEGPRSAPAAPRGTGRPGRAEPAACVRRRAGSSHVTFYLYFSNKEDLFKALLKDALRDMEIVAGDFPIVTSDDTGLKVLRQWVRMFFKAYAAHATVIRILSQADLVPEEVFGDGLKLFFSIAEAMTTGMTAAAEAAGKHQEHAQLTAVACLMMLERVNYLISAEVPLPEDELASRIAEIMYAAFGLNLP